MISTRLALNRENQFVNREPVRVERGAQIEEWQKLYILSRIRSIRCNARMNVRSCSNAGTGSAVATYSFPPMRQTESSQCCLRGSDNYYKASSVTEQIECYECWIIPAYPMIISCSMRVSSLECRPRARGPMVECYRNNRIV